MPKLSQTISRVSRAVPLNATSLTVEGKQSYKKFACRCCRGLFLVAEAYMQSKSRRKDDNDIRPFCVPCWIKYNGKTYESLRKEKDFSDGNLEEFF